eukprot:7154094-Prymnesium_polylepis.1
MSSNEIMLNLRVVRSETKLSMLVGNATSPVKIGRIDELCGAEDSTGGSFWSSWCGLPTKKAGPNE